jgi:cell division septum initiation protein DivIVA
MPDKSTAATEHSLIQEITAPLARLPEDPVPEVADVDFPLSLRGYDRLAVDAYVRKTSQLVAELQATRSPEAAVRRALARVGEEVSGILQRAHETAEQLTSQSRVEADERLEAARREASEITSGADRRVADLDSETDRIWAERHRIVEDARELARQLLALADSAAERFPAAPEETSESESESEPADGEQPSLDKWEGEELDHWADEDAGEHEDLDETEATTAMPPVAPGEPVAQDEEQRPSG